MSLESGIYNDLSNEVLERLKADLEGKRVLQIRLGKYLEASSLPCLQQSGKKTTKKRVYKKHSCFYCGTLQTNITRHLRLKHSQEERVIEANKEAQETLKFLRDIGKQNLAHPAFEKLRKDGDLKYNYNESKQLIPVRSVPNESKASFVVCVKCNGYYSQSNYRRHVRIYCGGDNMPRNIIGTARLKRLKVHPDACKELITDFFPNFTKKNQRDVIISDSTAVNLANKLIMKYHISVNYAGKHTFIASTLRLLVDIFIIIKDINPEIKEILDIFHPKEYDNLIKAIKIRSGYQNGRYTAPTTATTACNLFLKVAAFLKCEAIKNMNSEMQKRLDNFEYLLKKMQNSDVNKVANENKTEVQRAKNDILPTTNEIKSLMDILENEYNESLTKARQNFNWDTYASLCSAVLAYLMVFNRKRPGDCQKSRVVEYRNISTADKDYMSRLDDAEKSLACRYSRYRAQGKLNKKCSNIVPQFLKEGIDFILQRRCLIGVPDQCEFIFATPKSKRNKFFLADRALKKICQKHGLDETKFGANKLRKHLATCTSSLDEKYQSTIYDFMGHTKGVHKDIYQQVEINRDIVFMSKILEEACGLAPATTVRLINSRSDFHAERINAPWLTEKDIRGIDNDDDDGNVGRSFNNSPNPGSENDTFNYYDNETIQQRTIRRKLFVDTETKQMEPDEEYEPSTSCSSSDEEDDSSNAEKLIKRDFKITSTNKKTWSTPERLTVRHLFQNFIDSGKVPTTNQVQDVAVGNIHLRGRSYSNIRSWIIAEINRKRQGNRRWTTPQKKELRRRFKPYFDRFRDNQKICRYPSKGELLSAIKEIPELNEKTEGVLRSKIQHEYSLIAYKAKMQRETVNVSNPV